MSEQYVVYIVREAFYTTLLVSAPILLVSLVIGLVVSVIQAATSIQEFTLTFVPKLIGMAVVLVLTLPWMMDTMISFTMNLFNSIPTLGR
ncbi:MAG TPA: flagellar biosynthesis protein FliQ [Bacteroidota bacterium]|nr:flagellar biosynthesis protein FliQ [Bacteroidota bacterium]